MKDAPCRKIDTPLGKKRNKSLELQHFPVAMAGKHLFRQLLENGLYFVK